MYEPYVNATDPAVDEYTLSQNVANDPNSGGLEKYFEDHYSTFIVSPIYDSDFLLFVTADRWPVRLNKTLPKLLLPD